MSAKANTTPIESYLKNVGLWYMERYATSTHKMRTYLLQKAQKRLQENVHNNETIKQYIENIIIQYTEAGYLNDSAYAQMQIRKLLRRGSSLKKIEDVLYAKGIHKESGQKAKTAVAEEYSQSIEELSHASAIQYAKRKKLGHFGHKKEEETIEETRIREKKECAKMMAAGFSYTLTKEILNTEDDMEEPDEETMPWTT